MEAKTLQSQKGFTLVEIAIVLVIIGLLLGGVLKGQELIENTKIKSIKTESDAALSALYGYQDRFRVMPGDDGAANVNAAGAGVVATNGTQNNGVIEGNFNSSAAADESFQFWLHARLAGFLSGDAVIADGTAPQPINSFGGIMGITSNAAGTTGISICHTGLSVEQMTLVDTRYDDGVVDSGVVRGIADAAAAVDAAYDANTFGMCITY